MPGHRFVSWLLYVVGKVWLNKKKKMSTYLIKIELSKRSRFAVEQIKGLVFKQMINDWGKKCTGEDYPITAGADLWKILSYSAS